MDGHVELYEIPQPSLMSVWEKLPLYEPPLVKNVLRRHQKLIIRGPGKSGKTSLVTHLAVAVAEGTSWLDNECSQGGVLFVNLGMLPWLNKGSSMIFGYDWWIPFFSEVGFITNDENLVLNDDKIVLYRGSLPWLKEGMSWTTNKEFAELFASQFPESNLYTIEVSKNELLGVFYGSAGTTDDVENVAYGYEYVLNSRKIEGKTSQL